ncbi:hypothetical protein [Blastococcus litoris]|uniref:hypothetical protein n=1 Tax=Blastococcus litoris TaxID=2171622 RepID=UPI000E303A41|nr:hypothetical protein [Blastococcus litoris]
MSHPAGETDPDDRSGRRDGIDPRRGRRLVLSTAVAAILVVAAVFLLLYQCGSSADDVEGSALRAAAGAAGLLRSGG